VPEDIEDIVCTTDDDSSYDADKGAHKIKRESDSGRSGKDWADSAPRSKFDNFMVRFKNRNQTLWTWVLSKLHGFAFTLEDNRIINRTESARTNATMFDRIKYNSGTLIVAAVTTFVVAVYYINFHHIVNEQTLSVIKDITKRYQPIMSDSDFVTYESRKQIKDSGIKCKHGDSDFVRSNNDYLLDNDNGSLLLVSVESLLFKHEWLILEQNVSDYMATTMHMNFTRVPCLCSVLSGGSDVVRGDELLHMVDPHIVAYSIDSNTVSEFNALVDDMKKMSQKKIPVWLTVEYRDVEYGQLTNTTFYGVDVNAVDNCMMFLNELPHGATRDITVDTK
jgi:hypothetical protein